MSRWDQRFEEHALWRKVTAAQDQVASVKPPKGATDRRETLAQMANVLSFVEARKTGTSAALVSHSMLDSAAAAVDQLVNHLDYLTSGQYSDSQMDPLIDGVLQALATWPPASPDQTARALRSAAKKISSIPEEMLASLENQHASLAQASMEIEQQIAQFGEQIDQHRALLDSAIEEFRVSGESRRDELETEWAAEREQQEQQGREAIARLEDLEKEARELVHAASGSVVATDYGRYARNKTIAAWVCDVAAALIGAVGVAAIIYHLYAADDSAPGADGDVGLSLTRLAASLGTLGIAALVAHRGHDHHQEARAAKRTDLALRRVGPFTSNLPPDVQERIVVETTDRIFVRGELGDVAESSGQEDSLWDRVLNQRAKRGEE